MKKIVNFVLTVIFVFLLSVGYGGCIKLNGAKGQVVNVLTGLPIEGVDVVATSSSDIESEQKYLLYTTKTDKNGNFRIKGLARKTYRIQVKKAGFTQGKASVSIPEKSIRLIEKPLYLCPLPPKRGVFLYNGKFEEITISKPYRIFPTPKQCCGHKSLFYKAADLKDIPPMRGNYLIQYGTWSKKPINKIYWLFRRTKRDNLGEAESTGDYFTLGGYYSQSSETYCSFELEGFSSKFEKVSGDNRKNHHWGSLKAIFFSRDNKLLVTKLDQRQLPRGYYFLGHGNRYHIEENMPSFLFNLQ